MSQIGLSYTPSGGSPVYNIVLGNFGDQAFPRSYLNSTEFSQSASGATILDGPAYEQKYQWVISSIVPTAIAEQFDAMFQAWDADRANGLAAACGVTDETFGPTVTTSVIFVTAPSYTYKGPAYTMISFGLQEV